MKSGFTQFIKNHPIPKCLFEDNLFSWDRIEGKLAFKYAGKSAYIKDYLKKGFLAALQLDQQHQLTKRPRILQFNDIDFGLLENIEINISPEQYEQPFPTTILEMPNEYKADRLLPSFVVSTWRRELRMLMLHIYLPNGVTYGCVFGNTDHTLESQLNGLGITFIGSLPISEQEKEIYNKITRAALNACLLATQMELVSSPENPKYFERLKNAKRGTPDWYNFKVHPTIYRPKQEIQLNRDFIEWTGGWTVKPHWRRPHWRLQRHGPGLTLTKRILIPAVFVNQGALNG